MAAWDPFGAPEDEPGLADAGAKEAAKSAPVAGATAFTQANVRALAEKLVDTCLLQEPWNRPPDMRPNTKWHTPTCSSSADWRHKDVKFEVGQGIAYVIWNRPDENNSMNDSMGAGLNDALWVLHKEKEMHRVAVFMGEGRMFSSGGDPKAWQAAAAMGRGERIDGDGTTGIRIPGIPPSEETIKEWMRMVELGTKAGAFQDGNVEISRVLAGMQWNTWALCPQFTIALVNGSAMGGGVGMICCCDYVIAVDRAYIVLSEVKIGVIPATISPYVIGKMGASNAKRLFCTGENMKSERAKEVGIVNDVVKNMKEGHKKVKEICDLITACGPRSVEACKNLVWTVAGQPVAEPILFFTCNKFNTASKSDEAKVGMTCLQAKTPKPWEAVPIVPLY